MGICYFVLLPSLHAFGCATWRPYDSSLASNQGLARLAIYSNCCRSLRWLKLATMINDFLVIDAMQAIKTLRWTLFPLYGSNEVSLVAMLPRAEQ